VNTGGCANGVKVCVIFQFIMYPVGMFPFMSLLQCIDFSGVSIGAKYQPHTMQIATYKTRLERNDSDTQCITVFMNNNLGRVVVEERQFVECPLDDLCFISSIA